MSTNDDRRLQADPSTIELTHTTHLTITRDVIPSTPNRTQKRDTPASAGHPLTRRLPTRSPATLNKVDTTVADISSDYNALRYELCELPASVENGVRRYMAAFGLVYAAFDFAIDATGQWYFLEANTAGQYGFLETHTGAAIGNALADLLAGGVS